MTHIRRERLPWRTKELYTECGIECKKVDAVMTHEEYRRKYGNGRPVRMKTRLVQKNVMMGGTPTQLSKTVVDRVGDVCKICSERDEKITLWHEDALRAHADASYRHSALERVELKAFAALAEIYRHKYLELLRAFTVEAVATRADVTARELRACYTEFANDREAL